MRAAVRSVSARSVSGLRAGSALTIGVGVADAYAKAANVLRPVGGRMFIASPQYAAINTDGTGAITNGSAVGLWRDYASGATLTQATAGKKLVARKVPILGPELVVNGDFSNGTTGWSVTSPTQASISSDSGELVVSVTTGIAGVSQSLTTTAGRAYQITANVRRGTTSDVRLRANDGTFSGSILAETPAITNTTPTAVTITATAIGVTTVIHLRCNGAGTGYFDNISFREITGYTQQWEFVSDGADDVLVGSAGQTLSDGLVMVWAGKISGVKTARIMRLKNAANNRALMLAQTADSQLTATLVGGTSTVFAGLNSGYSSGENVVCSVVSRGGNLLLRKNGVLVATAPIGQAIGDALTSLTISGDEGISFSACAASSLQYANLGANATDANIRILEEAAAKAAGVVLP